jgi:hypothetical protein
MDLLSYGYAIHLLRAIEAGADPQRLIEALTRKHTSVSADSPNGTKDRVASACCNKFDECVEHIGEVEYAGARFILFADRPDVGAEPEAPAVPLLFKDWKPNEGPITVFYKTHEFPGVSWGQERKRVGSYSYLVYPSTSVKPLLRLPKGSNTAQSLITMITGAREKKDRMQIDLQAVVASLKRQSL